MSSPTSNEEILDLVDKDDNVIGSVKKSEAHGNLKLTHREIAVILKNLKGEVLIQQRSKKKKIYPLLWGISCSGHVESGEDPKKAAGREVQEELGIEVELTFVKKFYKENNEIPESKFYYIYIGTVTDQVINFNEDEVAQVMWISKVQYENEVKNYTFGNVSRELLEENL